ncbi:BMP1 [Branchiostoma lanceolatum]|uniref:BMP1 protein n=1 Tax=Branchiostoma lanceolatum TaxID=7740 RepID=A0A8K0AED0_BRALA|nr:BMP1 [Branchiostoma lanceolatum]
MTMKSLAILLGLLVMIETGSLGAPLEEKRLQTITSDDDDSWRLETILNERIEKITAENITRLSERIDDVNSNVEKMKTEGKEKKGKKDSSEGKEMGKYGHSFWMKKRKERSPKMWSIWHGKQSQKRGFIGLKNLFSNNLDDTVDWGLDDDVQNWRGKRRGARKGKKSKKLGMIGWKDLFSRNKKFHSRMDVADIWDETDERGPAEDEEDEKGRGKQRGARKGKESKKLGMIGLKDLFSNNEKLDSRMDDVDIWDDIDEWGLDDDVQNGKSKWRGARKRKESQKRGMIGWKGLFSENDKFDSRMDDVDIWDETDERGSAEDEEDEKGRGKQKGARKGKESKKLGMIGWKGLFSNNEKLDSRMDDVDIWDETDEWGLDDDVQNGKSKWRGARKGKESQKRGMIGWKGLFSENKKLDSRMDVADIWGDTEELGSGDDGDVQNRRGSRKGTSAPPQPKRQVVPKKSTLLPKEDNVEDDGDIQEKGIKEQMMRKILDTPLAELDADLLSSLDLDSVIFDNGAEASDDEEDYDEEKSNESPTKDEWRGGGKGRQKGNASKGQGGFMRGKGVEEDVVKGIQRVEEGLVKEAPGAKEDVPVGVQWAEEGQARGAQRVKKSVAKEAPRAKDVSGVKEVPGAKEVPWAKADVDKGAQKERGQRGSRGQGGRGKGGPMGQGGRGQGDSVGDVVVKLVPWAMGDVVREVPRAKVDVVKQISCAKGDVVNQIPWEDVVVKLVQRTKGDVVREVPLARGDVVNHVPWAKGDVVKQVPWAKRDVVKQVLGARGDVVKQVLGPRGDVVKQVLGARGDVVKEAQWAKGDVDINGSEDEECSRRFGWPRTPASPLCGETTFLAGTGYVTSPNYPHFYPSNIDCTYHIAATPGMMVLIRFIGEFEFESKNEGACKYDNITVVVNGIHTLGTYCGQEPPGAITGATVDIRLKTDFAISKKGFRLRYEVIDPASVSPATESPATESPATESAAPVSAAPVSSISETLATCAAQSTTTVSGVTRTLTSPLFPDNYPNRLYCSWTFLAPKDKFVEVRFLTLSVEAWPKCLYDSVVVLTDGTETSDGPYCTGNQPSEAFYGKNVTVKFVSDSAVTSQGFELTYRGVQGVQGSIIEDSMLYNASPASVSPATVSPATESPATESPAPVSAASVSAAPVSSISETLATCAAHSTTTVSGVTRTLTSPLFPDDYPNRLSCSWTFLAPKDKFVEVRFLTLSLEAAPKCIYDSVVVLTDGTETSDGPYCTGNQPSKAFYGKNVTVKFISDNSVAKQGFKLTYRSVQGANIDRFRRDLGAPEITYEENNGQEVPSEGENYFDEEQGEEDAENEVEEDEEEDYEDVQDEENGEEEEGDEQDFEDYKEDQDEEGGTNEQGDEEEHWEDYEDYEEVQTEEDGENEQGDVEQDLENYEDYGEVQNEKDIENEQGDEEEHWEDYGNNEEVQDEEDGTNEEGDVGQYWEEAYEEDQEEEDEQDEQEDDGEEQYDEGDHGEVQDEKDGFNEQSEDDDYEEKQDGEEIKEEEESEQDREEEDGQEQDVNEGDDGEEDEGDRLKSLTWALREGEDIEDVLDDDPSEMLRKAREKARGGAKVVEGKRRGVHAKTGLEWAKLEKLGNEGMVVQVA